MKSCERSTIQRSASTFGRDSIPELWFEDIVVLSHLVAGEHRIRRAQAKTLTMTSTLRPRLKAARGFVVAGDSDLLDLKEYDGIRIVSPRVFLDLIEG